jgi:predicted Zn-dependent protease
MTPPRPERRLARLTLAAAATLALASCALLEQQGQPNIPVPPHRVRPGAQRLDSRALVQHKELVAQFGGEYQAPAAARHLDGILARLAATSETPGQQAYRVTILNTPIVNAFALPSGNIYVTRGLIALANDSSEVGAVMAHEISHVTAHHSALRDEREKVAAVISQAAAVMQSRQKGEEIRSSQRLSVASFSRQQELDADAMGVRAVARAGYDPYGAARFLVALGKSTELREALSGKKKSAAGFGFDILATHPSTPDRVNKAVAAARQIGAPGVGTRDREAYLAAIAGVAFGDDPNDGFVRGRKFTHPRLRFALTAPESFLLENSSEAVFGIREDSKEALHLDNVRPPAFGSLETYMQSGWVDGLLASSVRRTEVNGMPAVTAQARAGEWNFEVAVIQNAEDIYRLIFAVRAINEDADRRFHAMLQSFHRLTPDEASTAHGLRLAVVAAAPDDTLMTMAARMVTPNRPLEYFLLLNGLEAAAPLTPGEKYKIIVE